MYLLNNPDLIFAVIVIPLSLVLHEFSHALAADLLGDRTPRNAGRLTLNPLVHLDLLGLIMIFISPIGWAKPVIINSSNFKSRRLGTIITAFAGPLSNFILGCLCLFLIRHFQLFYTDSFVTRLLSYGGEINLVLCIFNLFPIPPFDGSRILSSLLPSRLAYRYNQFGLYAPFLFLLLFLLPTTNTILSSILFNWANWVAGWFGLAMF